MRTGTVISDGLNLRVGPAQTYPFIDQLNKGDKLELFDEELNGDVAWLKVRVTRTGQHGWVARANSRHTFVQLDGPRVVFPPEPAPPVQASGDWFFWAIGIAATVALLAYTYLR